MTYSPTVSPHGHDAVTVPGGVVLRIEEIRTARGRSITWLSDAAAIPDKTLRRRLRDPDQFTLSELSAVMRAFGLRLEDLFDPAWVDLQAVA